MNTFMKRLTVCAFLAVCLVSSVALGDVVQTHYKTLRDGCPAIPTNLSAASAALSTAWAAPLNPQPTRGNPYVTCYAKFSTASATSDIQVGLYYKNADATYTFLGFSAATTTITAAASGTTDGTGVFPGLTTPTWDTKGAPYYDLRIRTISAGTVTIRPWVYGAESKGTE